MDIKFAAEGRGDAIAVMAADKAQLLASGQALDAKTNGAIAKAMQTARFTGASGQMLEIFSPVGVDAARILVIGVGDLERAEGAAAEKFGAAAARKVNGSGGEKLVLHSETLTHLTAAEAAARAAIGARLGVYRFDAYRTKLKPEQKPSLQEITVVLDGPAAARSRYEKESTLVEAVHFARDLVAEPPNVLYPAEFARRLKELERFGLEVSVLGEAEMEKLGMHALLGVGRGSARESQLVVMRWKGLRNANAQPIALVGKGVTFDTGGISLKPGPGMEEMKGDMGGAAAVSGAMMAIAARKAKANVVGVVGLVENMPDGDAQRPGDIVKTMSGQTIEIQNTDAEGRLLLADAVWYAQDQHNPTTVIDLATLTGAVIVSLGHEYAGLFANDDDLAGAIVAAGQAEGEPVWRLPLGPAYDKMIDSPFADMKNIAGKPAAGSIIGASFIKRFIKDGVKWAHLDIAGTAWKPGPYDDPLHPSWATGYGVRLLNRLIAHKFED
ncbi:MAG: leucyl aminopeptidase [Alphaproteobacteria bacterium]|nr:leucyl aminopeptidase [Alphaproteobacteria bacterium]